LRCFQFNAQIVFHWSIAVRLTRRTRRRGALRRPSTHRIGAALRCRECSSSDYSVDASPALMYWCSDSLDEAFCAAQNAASFKWRSRATARYRIPLPIALRRDRYTTDTLATASNLWTAFAASMITIC
jgi:hypothetical protein